ncbi:MAG: 5-formyltetrahydrofolate cyclo-ligase [Mariprofundaceae bacterium]|nr:5-formyltetrahydrofolate cyclo-ligase [Mariprofundaceae bacterium]
MSNISQLKQQCRLDLSAQRQQLSPAQRQHHSQRIFEHSQDYLKGVPQPMELLIYRALAAEVDTSFFFNAGFTHIYAPRMLPQSGLTWVRVQHDTIWQKVDFGVLEPTSGEIWQKNKLKTLMICPLLGFDRLGNRLGMGKGYFDRWLEHHANEVDQQLGLAFSLQELPKVPTEPHDAPLSTIITEREVITCLNH